MPAKRQQPKAETHIWFDRNTPPPGNCVWKPVWCAGYDEVEAPGPDGKPTILRKFHHFENKPCSCPPGPQQLGMWSPARYLALIGGRGGLKTETVLALTVQGNQPFSFRPESLVKFQVSLEKPRQIRITSTGQLVMLRPGDQLMLPYKPASDLQQMGAGVILIRPWDLHYVKHPRYKFLVIRKNYDDLRDFFDRGREFYGHFGGEAIEHPVMMFRFPSGAQGILGHLKDENAFGKWQGQQFQRMVIEEASQIPEERSFDRLNLSCRSVVSDLREQTYLTFNPGGPGGIWTTRRFIKLKQPDGTPVKSGELWTHPRSGETYMFIHSTVYDNPYFLRDNAAYVRTLEGLEGIERERWLRGNFDAVEGAAFPMFRRERLPGEPPEAMHVVPARSIKLAPWWHRWIGMDWGYGHHSAVYWACQHPNGQMFIYRELVVQGMGSVELGAEIARLTLQELEELEGHQITLHLSKEVWRKTDEEKPISGQLAYGIGRIVGQDAVYLPQTAEAENVDEALSEFRGQRRAGIFIRPANNHRISGWQYMRELMRWKQVVSPLPDAFDHDYFSRLVARGEAEKADSYRKGFEKRVEVLPKLQIVEENCPKLIDSIITAVLDETLEDLPKKGDNVELDCLDSARYLCQGHKYEAKRVPLRYFLQEKLDEARKQYDDPTILMQIQQFQEAKYKQQFEVPVGINLPRLASSRWRQ